MNYFKTIPVSQSKLPLLLEGEIETLLQENVAIYEGDKLTKYEKGYVSLTNFRVLWVDRTYQTAPIALSLADVADADADSSFKIKGSPKIVIVLKNNAQLKLSFRDGGRDAFLQRLKSSLRNKAWEQQVAKPSPKSGSFSTNSAGIGGIMRSQEEKQKETNQVLQAAFTDINALIDKAKDMVGLAEKLAAQQNKQTGNSEEDNELRSMLVSMGISSPVTKETAGSLYHEQLSRQLADWLQKSLERFGGMIAVTDLFCLFNRARGIGFISPDDLYRACILFEQLQLPVRLRRFDSGVLVVQSVNQNDETVGKQISDTIRIDGPCTAFHIARTKNISIALANEELQTAERLGYICRDETVEGVTYYLNFFLDPSALKLYLKV